LSVLKTTQIIFVLISFYRLRFY